jgi:glutathione S-transferase
LIPTLYYAPGTIALATHIALAEAQAEYRLVRLDFAKTEQRGAEYLAVNPKGRVPALVTDRGILTETPALLTYVAQTHPAARLAPFEDAFAFARIQAFMAYLCSTVHVAHAHLRRGARWADSEAAISEMAARAPANMDECFRLIEAEMLQGPWVMGEHYTIADPYLFTLAGWLERHGIDIARYPKVSEHHVFMLARPAVRRALEEQGQAA